MMFVIRSVRTPVAASLESPFTGSEYVRITPIVAEKTNSLNIAKALSNSCLYGLTKT
jgi:hypothetical protein